jgi:hypothetical protein
MQVDRTNDGTWRVIAADGEVLASGLSNAEAWDFIDSRDETAADDDAEARDWAARYPVARETLLPLRESLLHPIHRRVLF